MTPRWYIPVAGTWARSRQDAAAWYRCGSRFDNLMRRRGYDRVEQDGDPSRPDRGYWSGDVGGLLAQRLWPWSDPHEPWTKGAAELRRFLHARRAEFGGRGVALVAHSHGGQVVAYALAGLHVGTREAIGPIAIVTVDTPIRQDMASVYRQALAHGDHWTHCYSERGLGSMWRWLGNRFGTRQLEGADRNLEVTGGHSGILSDPVHMDRWHGILDGLEPVP